MISYRKLKGDDPEGDKYELTEHVYYRSSVKPTVILWIPQIALHPDGLLRIRRLYQWDGASGPTIDTASNLRASLIHDALYELLRSGLLGKAESAEWRRYRKLADQELYRIMREDGANWLRAQYYYWAVRLFAGRFAR